MARLAKWGMVLTLVAAPAIRAASAQVFMSEPEALKTLFPQATWTEEVKTLDKAAREELTRSTRLRFSEDAYRFHIAKVGGDVVGYALTLNEIGKSEPITFTVGMDAKGKISDVILLVYRESRGAEVRDKRFLSQFRGKSERDPIQVNRDILNYSGATLSSIAIARGVRKALALFGHFYGPDAKPRAEVPRAPLRRAAAVSATQPRFRDNPRAPAAALAHYIEERYLMGTLCAIEVYGRDQSFARQAVSNAFDAMKDVDLRMSNFRADSELSRVNRLAGSEPVTVSGELFTVLDFALKVSRASHGAFDITVAPLLRALGFLPTLPEMLPSDFAPAESCAGRQSKAGGNPVLPDYRKVLLDPAAKTVRFAECGVAVDLGGIAKGYAVDRAVEALRRAGIRAARVSAGGSTIYALGTPPSQPAWRIGIRHPAKQEELLAVVPLKDASLSTSGSYEKSRIIHGQTYSHILDPRTGLSADNMLSSTVIAPSAMESDALSTATFVLGWEKAEDLLERRHRCGLFVTRRKEGAGVAVHGVPPAVQGCF